MQLNSASAITLTLSKAQGSYIPPKRKLVVKFINVHDLPKSVELNGNELAKIGIGSLDGIIYGWAYNAGARQVLVVVQDGGEENRIMVHR